MFPLHCFVIQQPVTSIDEPVGNEDQRYTVYQPGLPCPKSRTLLDLVMINIAMENHLIFKNGKPSISMGHLYHGYVE